MLIDLALCILLTSQAMFLSVEGEQKVIFHIKELGPPVITTPRRARLGTIKRRQTNIE